MEGPGSARAGESWQRLGRIGGPEAGGPRGRLREQCLGWPQPGRRAEAQLLDPLFQERLPTLLPPGAARWGRGCGPESSARAAGLLGSRAAEAAKIARRWGKSAREGACFGWGSFPKQGCGAGVAFTREPFLGAGAGASPASSLSVGLKDQDGAVFKISVAYGAETQNGHFFNSPTPLQCATPTPVRLCPAAATPHAKNPAPPVCHFQERRRGLSLDSAGSKWMETE